jgi:hypothetical protein
LLLSSGHSGETIVRDTFTGGIGACPEPLRIQRRIEGKGSSSDSGKASLGAETVLRLGRNTQSIGSSTDAAWTRRRDHGRRCTSR